ncbi:hypothetical protein LR48_Vigan09g152700 [Vigna angularis]|uniref:Sodium/calcium exchanger membrane region domain-containing protein n=2 Tax=Phaseolus angularis TaxID=3914 RepID=A0A0L9VCX7_PHAAN|nr:hypothetical protein LR48_Vigan09g152700 [Vigna angularis]
MALPWLRLKPKPKASSLSIILTTTLILLVFFFFSINPPSPISTPRRSLLFAPSPCAAKSNGILKYQCLFPQHTALSIPILSLFLLLHFYILITTAQDHFSLVTTKLASHLALSPSMAAVTLLSLGNGAPDVFSSFAALRAGQYRTGFGAILSAGTFVSALVVGFVAIFAAPFSVDPAPFVRDVLFYLTAAMFLFYVYLSAEIFLWQAVGFVAFYLFFVGFVFYMDLGMADRAQKSSADLERQLESDPDAVVSTSVEGEKRASGVRGAFRLVRCCCYCSGFNFAPDFSSLALCTQISKTWELPVETVLRLTIPQPAPAQWSRFYASANIALCPLALLYACNSFMPFNHSIVFLLPNTHFPLWSVVFMTSFSLAFLHFIIEKEPPKTEHLPVVVMAFVMSVFWISTTAGELVNCLEAIGTHLKLPPALLGLTVLAWGNSVGDLVADVAVAKAGHPAMAMAGCFAGPMFNMLVGLGSALVIQTANIYPRAYQLNFHVGIVMAFVFLLLSLMGSLLVITWCRFRVPRFWGFCLVGIYAAFTAASLGIAMFSG